MILRIIRLLDRLLTLTVSLVLVCTGAFACYALWDNRQVYQAAENVRAAMLRLKPDAQAEEGPSFEELLALNPDVCAWITMDNTGIDYPVLQGGTNLTYINTDVYGDFALAGSIFLDSRCSRTFSDAYSLLYGHHMENGSMFGDLDLYEEEEFFEENRTGTLLLPSEVISLRTLACLTIEASEEKIFDMDQWQEDIPGLSAFIRENALYCDEALAEEVERAAQGAAGRDDGAGLRAQIAANAEPAPEETGSAEILESAGTDDGAELRAWQIAAAGVRILALSTCSSDFTNARTVLITVMYTEDF